MPRRAKGARLYLAPPAMDARTRAPVLATWVIRDGKTFVRTGCAEGDVGGAERVFQTYLANKHLVDRTPDRRASDIEVADVLNIYAQDIVAKHARPKETAARIKALEAFWGDKRLSEVTGHSCRTYTRSRPSRASARRELEDLRSAINHHRQEGYCTEIVGVVLPDRGEARERWLTRVEAARLIRAAYRYREVQKGHPTGRRSRRHVARFILVGLYTGTRAGAICSAAFEAGPGQGFLDLERGVFYRKRGGAKETKKRQTPVRLPDRLLAHLRRWRRLGISDNFAVEFNGRPIGKINKAFRAAVKEAGLSSDVIPHCLRHTAATWGMQNGTDVNELAGFLGMTVEMLDRVYGHHHPDFQEGAAAGVSGKGRARRLPSAKRA